MPSGDDNVEAVEGLPTHGIVALESMEDKDLRPESQRRRSHLLCAVATLLVVGACVVVIPVMLLARNQPERSSNSAPLAVAIPTSEQYCPWKYGVPKFPHEDLPGLDMPSYVSEDGTTMMQALNYSDGDSSVQLYYEAKLIKDWNRILALDIDERVVNATCDGHGLLTLHFGLDTAAASALVIDAASAAASGVNQSLITGSYAWGCTCEELGEGDANSTTDTYCTIQHKVVEVVSVGAGATAGSSAVTVRLAPAALTELFESVKLYYTAAPSTNSTNTTEPSYAEEPSELHYTRPSGSGAPPRRELVFDWLGAMWGQLMGFIGGFLDNLDQTLRNTIATINAAVSGNMQVSQSRTIQSWKWEGSNLPGFPLDLSGSEASWDIGVRIELDIRSHNLHNLEVAAYGQAALTAQARLVSGSSPISGSWEVLRSTRVGGPVTFAIGVLPIKLQAHMSMSASIEMDAAVTGGTMTTGSNMAWANVEHGIRATRRTDWFGNPYHQWDRPYSADWGLAHGRPSLSLPSSISASAVVSLEPTLYLVINGIGGPTITLIPYVAAEFEADPTDDWFTDPHCGATVGTGVTAYVGARINVLGIIQHTLDPHRVLSWGPHRVWNCDCSEGCSPQAIA